jgi:phosphatidylglycerol---prolipoprotein diacylglyceryl transferase
MDELIYNWQHIYESFDPVAFWVVHWYGIMYALALVSAFFVGKWMIQKDKIDISNESLGNYFFWIEVGIILGARLGYVLFYDPNTWYYISHPWQIFNPFQDGQFVGIRGMSYHGALIGFLLSSYLYARKHKESFWLYMDLVAVSVPIGYVFGRIGNFLNQELIGNETTVAWGVYYGDILVHPSQLYEAFLEGVVVFAIMMFIRRYKSFDGMLALAYAGLYGMARFIAEFYRAPDIQIGYIWGTSWLTMGQALSGSMVILGVLGLYLLKRHYDNNPDIIRLAPKAGEKVSKKKKTKK